jgi:phosphorylcholine metabolism protein LicD
MTKPRRQCTRETPRCEFWKWSLNYLRPDCCTHLLKEVLFFTTDLLERHGIPYWIDYGTLLGAVRDGGFIPWDSDADLGVDRKDWPRVLELLPEFERAGYFYWERPDGGAIASSTQNWNHLDIFYWEERDGWMVNDCWPAYGFPAHFSRDLDSLELYGRRFPKPRQADEFLRGYRYGPAYRTACRPTWNIPDIPFPEITPAVILLMNELRERDFLLGQLHSRVKDYEKLTELGRARKATRDFVAGKERIESLTRNLALFFDALERGGIAQRYWVIGGLLLGWAREGGVMPHDADDADFGILESDRAALLAAVPELVKAGFEPRSRYTRNGGDVAQYRFEKDGAKFEFFMHVPVGDRLRTWFFGEAQNGSGPRQPRQYVSEVPADELAPMPFLGREWRKPADHERYLTAVYGDWRTPRPEHNYRTDDRSVVAVEPWFGRQEWPQGDWPAGRP